jgi:hypothetical protein
LNQKEMVRALLPVIEEGIELAADKYADPGNCAAFTYVASLLMIDGDPVAVSV